MGGEERELEKCDCKQTYMYDSQPARIQILSPPPLRPRNLGTIERYLILTNKVGIRKHTTARYRSVVCPLIKLYQLPFSLSNLRIFVRKEIDIRFFPAWQILREERRSLHQATGIGSSIYSSKIRRKKKLLVRKKKLPLWEHRFDFISWSKRISKRFSEKKKNYHSTKPPRTGQQNRLQ